MGQAADNYASKTQIKNYGLLQLQKKKSSSSINR